MLTLYKLLESLQRMLTSRIYGVHHISFWKILKSLNLMSLQRSRERNIMLQMFKILYSICPNDLNIQFCPPSRLGVKAIIPKLINRAAIQRHQTLYDKSFAVLDPHLWNIIPKELTRVVFRQQFQNSLSICLLSIPDIAVLPTKTHC